MIEKAKEVRKLLAGAVALAANAVAFGLVPEQYKHWVIAAIDIAGLFGIYKLANDDEPTGAHAA